MDSVFSPWPEQATLYGCPLSACKWAHTVPRPAQYAGGATIDECVESTLRAHFAEAEAVVREHLETHPLLEWAQEVATLQDQIASSAPAPTAGFPVQVHADWPEGCRCVIMGGVRAAESGCPLHDPDRRPIEWGDFGQWAAMAEGRSNLVSAPRPDSLYFFRRPDVTAPDREAEDRDRREWVEGVRQRLGIITIGDDGGVRAWLERQADHYMEHGAFTSDIPLGVTDGGVRSHVDPGSARAGLYEKLTPAPLEFFAIWMGTEITTERRR